MTFRGFLDEVKFKGKYQAFEQPLYESFLDFLQDYYNTDVDVTLSLKKNLPSKKFFGHVDLVEIKNKKYIITLEHIPYGILERIAHEFIHIKQIMRGELDYSSDLSELIWKRNGKTQIIKVEYYNNIKDYNTYKKIPWEAEAYKYQELMVKKYLKSKYFELLSTTKEPNLRFMIDNDLIK